ncbi:LysR family transcriptional regulator [Companilactobacillus versmoldensis]|uniref:Transcriptional regulator n=1 Tax=Companilactobacillus versmoldensis DSM 14857 = KCTC 3814 TaxID=1423815 RepID=A0A0R1SCH7_9LACO|nr:LysR family transcriptional regulator [Companilactobacillus versmoldensis]KRL66833.1 transcriptional regulator [Companilactobacillus versmoldensis DSM 14857 = KCTC 3814]
MLDKRFLTLAMLSQTGSYTETANRLFITQPAVSQQINSLESELDLVLVDKSKRKIRLTASGQKLAKFVNQLDIESQKFLDNLQQDDEQSHLKMGCTLSLSSTLLPRFIHQLSGRSKIVTSEINNTDQILKKLRQGKIDFGLVEGNFDKKEFDSIFLQNEDFICVANNQVEFEHPTIDQLFQENIFVREPGSGSREIFEHWLGTQNYRINDFEHIVEIASPTVIVQLLEENRGISFIYRSLVEEKLRQGKLKRLDLQGFQILHPINLVFLKNSYFAATYENIVKDVFER